MNKLFIAPIILAALISVPTMFGFIPAIIGVGSLLMLIVIFDLVLWWLTHGPPMEWIYARMGGGIILAVVKRTREIVFGRFRPVAGMINTEKHGSFTLMPERLYSAGGVILGIAPEKTGYNVGVDHAQLTEELKERGINKIEEVCDLDEYGQFKNFKDDPRIKDLYSKYIGPDGKIKAGGVKVKPELTTFDDFYKYTVEAASPIHQDANIKLGISQGLLGKETGKLAWLIGAGILVFLVCIGVFVLLQNRPPTFILENAGHIIPM